MGQVSLQSDIPWDSLGQAPVNALGVFILFDLGALLLAKGPPRGFMLHKALKELMRYNPGASFPRKIVSVKVILCAPESPRDGSKG